jgi:hypothetical protein
MSRPGGPKGSRGGTWRTNMSHPKIKILQQESEDSAAARRAKAVAFYRKEYDGPGGCPDAKAHHGRAPVFLWIGAAWGGAKLSIEGGRLTAAAARVTARVCGTGRLANRRRPDDVRRSLCPHGGFGAAVA